MAIRRFASQLPPDRFVHEKLMALQPQNLRIGQARQGALVAGFAQAYAFDVEYLWRGLANRGVAKISIAPAYDTTTPAMTAAISETSQWGDWLPLAADQISATNDAAFGMRGIMAQNLKNSQQCGEAVRQYREWSPRGQQQGTNDRNPRRTKTNTAFRENLGAAQNHPGL